MRYSTDHRDNTHRKIVQVAARLFRRHGYSGTGVDSIMKQASLTAGGFYSHFRSKEKLLIEALEEALIAPRRAYSSGVEKLFGLSWLEAFLGRSFSSVHRDTPEKGCPLTALVSDFARSSKSLKETYEKEILRSVELLEERMPEFPGFSRKQRTLATVALIIGGINLARAVKNEQFSNEILQSCIAFAMPEKIRKQNAS